MISEWSEFRYRHSNTSKDELYAAAVNCMLNVSMWCEGPWRFRHIYWWWFTVIALTAAVVCLVASGRREDTTDWHQCLVWTKYVSPVVMNTRELNRHSTDICLKLYAHKTDQNQDSTRWTETVSKTWSDSASQNLPVSEFSGKHFYILLMSCSQQTILVW